MTPVVAEGTAAVTVPAGALLVTLCAGAVRVGLLYYLSLPAVLAAEVVGAALLGPRVLRDRATRVPLAGAAPAWLLVAAILHDAPLDAALGVAALGGVWWGSVVACTCAGPQKAETTATALVAYLAVLFWLDFLATSFPTIRHTSPFAPSSAAPGGSSLPFLLHILAILPLLCVAVLRSTQVVHRDRSA